MLHVGCWENEQEAHCYPHICGLHYALTRQVSSSQTALFDGGKLALFSPGKTTQNTESPFHGIQTWHVLRYVDMCTRCQVVKTKGLRDKGVPLVAAPASGSRT